MDLNKIRKKIEPFIAIGVFIMLVMLVVGLYKYNDTQSQIKDNCGYTSGEYVCLCHYSDNPKEELKSLSGVGKLSFNNFTYDLTELKN